MGHVIGWRNSGCVILAKYITPDMFCNDIYIAICMALLEDSEVQISYVASHEKPIER